MSKVELSFEECPSCKVIAYDYKDYKPSLYQLELELEF